MSTSLWLYVGFTAFVLTALALDLGIFHRKPHAVSAREAGIWVGVWVLLAALFAAGLLIVVDTQTSLLFVTGYLIELSLSIDNVFVMVLIFSYFSIPAKYQHRVLFWGILGALIMRGVFIGTGSFLIERFSWIMYIFGAFLVVTGVKMAFRHDEDFNADENIVMRFARRFLPVAQDYEGPHFLILRSGRRLVTPLFLVLLLIEFTDLVFALDSIPAIFAVTTNPFLVYTSNVFAILGLRSMYFLLSGIINRFVYLNYGLAVILTFVGLKMIVEDWVHIPIAVSLSVIALSLGVSVGASLVRSK
jgi:tellurite resistance protein TerC